MKDFYKKENTWIESIIFSFFTHLLIILALLSTPAILYLNELTETDPDTVDNSRLLVDLQDPTETETVASFIVSTNAALGSGQLTPTPHKRTHLLGEFLPPSQGHHTTPSEQTAQPTPQTDPTPFEFNITSTFKNQLTTTPPSPHPNRQTTLKSQDAKNPSQTSPPNVISGLESENTTNFRFHIDNNHLQRINIAKDNETALFLDIKKSLSYKMSLYANGPGGAGLINYRYLRVGEVSALITVDRLGNMNFLSMQKSSIDQPYLNYLIEKITTHEQAIHHFPKWFLTTQKDKLYFEIVLSYKGPPLYQWWVNIQLLTQAPNQPLR